MTSPSEPRSNRVLKTTTRLLACLAAVMVLAPVRASAAPPSNDNLAEGTVISAIPYTASGNTAEATSELEEPRPDCGFEVGKTVWYAYTPSVSEVLEADTLGSGFDTVLGVWTHDAYGNLDEATCNDDGRGALQFESVVVFAAEAGETYLFQVGGYDEGSGALAFRLRRHASGSISGTVTSTNGRSLRDARVDVWSAAAEEYVGSGLTTRSGTYTVTGIPNGTYQVEFSDCAPRETHTGEWYDDQPSFQSSDDVVVSGSGSVIGIDAELTRMTAATLQVDAAGGGGVISSQPGGISCAADCDEVYPIDTTVTLTASPDPGWELTSWLHCDRVQGSQCTVRMDGHRDVTGYFNQLQPGVAQTTITRAPESSTRSSSATFEFSSDREGSTFECSLDADGFLPCTSPVTYTGLSDEIHWFEVRARDPGGSADPSPSFWQWDVDLTAPNTRLSQAPPRATASRDATFVFAAPDEEATFRCSLDSAPLAPCTSPASYSGLAEGQHTLRIEAVDRVGNVEAIPGRWSWEIDSISPETRILSGPSGTVGSSTATITFEASEEGSTFACSLDSDPFSACTSPKSYAGLADGSHTFRVRATDRAGNVDASPDELTWTVESVYPETQLTGGPSGTSTSRHATFSFASTKPASTFQCSIDGKAFQTCTSPWTYSYLGEGTHVFRVRAADEEGRIDPSPAERTWVVDADGPLLSVQRPTAGAYVNDQSVGGTGPIVVVGSVTVQVTATDAQSGVSLVQFEVDGSPVPASAVTRQGDTFHFTFRPPSVGEHTITIRATNGSGVSSSMTRSVLGIPVA